MTSASDAGFQSLSGALQSEEPSTHQAPASASPATTNGGAAPESAPVPPLRHQTTLAGARSLHASASPSPTSPQASRDASPARPQQRNVASSGTINTRAGFRSRKSSADPSPSRGSSPAASSSSPSATAVHRALSSASTPQLPAPSTAEAARAPQPSKVPAGPSHRDNTPHWPISPRLRSPPPSGANGRSDSRSRANSLRNQIRKPEAQSTPAIVVQSSSPASHSRIPVREEPAGDQEEPVMSTKGPSRGASGVAPKLETVQESSLPATPGFDGIEADSFIAPDTTHKTSDEERNDVNSSKVTEDLSSSTHTSKHTGSGSDSGIKTDKKGKMQEQRPASSQRPAHSVSAKPSLSSLSTRSATQPSRNMTVETETVPSVAQSTIGNQDRSSSGRTDGSLRLKPSNETIRPKKERKPAKRKAPSINAGTGRSPHFSYHRPVPSRPDLGARSTTVSSVGSPVSYRSYNDWRSTATMSPQSPEMHVLEHRPSLRYFYSNTNTSHRKASSKADVFEQKVASAVDEADSSDSDATFIYESNPPEQPHRSRQHHSRTPSMTSLASLGDSRPIVRDVHKNPNKKSSMKFTNPYNNPGADPDALDRGEGMRVASGRVGGSHHHHIGRHGQGRGALGHLVIDSDSSMPQSSRARGPSSRQASMPNSPRFQQMNLGNGHSNGSKRFGEFAAYDMDAANAADDERTPLIQYGSHGSHGSGRSPRVRTPRRRNSMTLRGERRHRHNSGWCRRFAGCLVLSILLLVVIFCAVGLIFATTKPLTSLKIQSIQNVVASQDELMLDLVVDAVNPNIISVTISDMDVIIFAQSKHVGSDKWWRHHGNGPHDGQESWQPIQKPDIDIEDEHAADGIDEGTDPIEGEPRTMRLGRLFHFDSPLNFDGSFFARKRASSVGEIRLNNPGNKTEAGGTDRWEEVLQYPFEVIVRGNFKYQLPLSTREHKVPVTGSYYYDPDAEKKKVNKLNAHSSAEPEERRLIQHSVQRNSLGRYDRRASPLLYQHSVNL